MSTEKRPSGIRNWLIVVIIFVIAGVAAYFAGSFVQRTASAQDAAVARQQYALLQTQLASARARNSSLQSANHLLTAGVWAYRAAVALDNRNFGVANDAASKVVANLNGVDASAAGLPSSAVVAVKEEAAKVKISVATNLESQRSQVLHLASRIGALASATGTKTSSTR